jgi:16S rRNA (adenine1518-N6/adenine1519-N6)-dimethyltransferase
MGWIKRELNALQIPPLKRFGQHFLIDTDVRDTLVQQAALTIEDTVTEIGPGLGFLTAALASNAGRVIAVEKDRTLAGYLRSKFHENSKVTILLGDALETPFPDNCKIVSSPPYNISSKLILRILNAEFKVAILLLQAEFARRLSAPPASRDYGRLTIMLQCRAQARVIKEVPPSVFYPKPKVDSAIVKIEPLQEPLPIRDKKLFADLVRSLFTQRRRVLKTVLSHHLHRQYHDQRDEILSSIHVPSKRVFQTTPEELAQLSNEIALALPNQKGS